MAADARVGSRETRAGKKLEKIVEFFALRERVKENGHRAEIERHGAEPHQVRRDPRGLAADDADGFAARRQLPTHEFFDGERVGDVVRERRQIVQPIGVRHELVVLHVLGDLLVATMQKADVRRRLRDGFAIEFEDEPQDAVRSRMRRPHVEDHFLADVAEVFAHLRVRRRHARDGIRRFDFASGKSHEAIFRLCSREATAVQVQSLSARGAVIRTPRLFLRRRIRSACNEKAPSGGTNIPPEFSSTSHEATLVSTSTAPSTAEHREGSASAATDF